jgi:hypothetical protein
MLAPEGHAGAETHTARVHAAAAEGVRSGGGALPYGDRIQRSFGGYDISNVIAHTGAAAQHAASAMGANAYATGNDVVLGRGGTDLHTVAHEAAHVVQQRAGVSLSGGVGQAGDPYERHADAVADLVVQGKSAEGLLGEMAGGGGASQGVQLDVGSSENQTEMNFEEGETITVDTYELHANARPYDIIQDHTNAVADMIDVMGSNHLAGIANFIDTMQFEGSQAGQTDVLGSIFKSVGKSLLDGAVEGATGLVPIPGFSAVATWVKDAIEAATDEVERATKARGEASLAAWSREIRSTQAASWGSARIAFRATAEQSLPSMFDALDGIAPRSAAEGTVVTGDKATLLRNMQAHRSSLQTRIPTPQSFQDATAASWVTDRAGGASGSSADQGHQLSNGTIRIWVESEGDERGWSFEVQRVTMYTSSHGAQAADLVREAIASGRKTLWTCGVPVEVMFRGPNNMPGGRTWYPCSVGGRQQSAARGPWYPEAAEGWRALLADGGSWSEMESVARNRLEGHE